MKSYFCAIAIVVLFWGGAANGAELTASEYQPTQVETAVAAALDSMMKAGAAPNEAIDYLRDILKKYPDETVIHRAYQDMLHRDSLEELRQEYRKLAQGNPESAVYCYLNARIAASSQQRLEWAQRAIRNDPNYYWGHLALGYHYLTIRPYPDLAKAEESLLRAVEIDNSITAAFMNLANIYAMQADTLKLLEMFRLASTCEPGNFSYVAQIASILQSTKPHLAVVEVEHFLGENPGDERALRALKDLYAGDRQYRKAVEIARQLVEMGEDDAGDWYDLACAYALADMADSAFHALDESINRGWDDVRHLSQDPDLLALHGDPRWNTAAQKITSELERTAPDRRREALSNELNIPAPDFSYPGMDGNMVTLSDLRGKVVIIDFWALWCHWCLVAMPLLEEFWQQYQDKDVVVLSMNMMERQRDKVPGYIKEKGYTFRVVYGEDRLKDDYGIRGIPHLVVIDQEGIIRYKNIGYSPRLDEILSWQVESLLE